MKDTRRQRRIKRMTGARISLEQRIQAMDLCPEGLRILEDAEYTRITAKLMEGKYHEH